MELVNIVLLKTFAATYDCSSYGAGSYNADGQCVSESLVDTGSPYFIPLVAGTALVVLALTLIAVRFVHHRKASSSQRPN